MKYTIALEGVSRGNGGMVMSELEGGNGDKGHIGNGVIFVGEDAERAGNEQKREPTMTMLLTVSEVRSALGWASSSMRIYKKTLCVVLYEPYYCKYSAGPFGGCLYQK